MSSRIEDVIGEIEEYIDNCKFQPLSNTKIVVNKDEIEELLSELRLRTPEEIKRYQKIISNKEAILADAQAKAEAIVAKAEVQTTELVSEHQIMQQAYEQANEIVGIATKQAQEILDSATEDANNIRLGAIEYTDSLLKNTEDMISHAIEVNQNRYDSLMSSLKECFETIVANRKELAPQQEEAERNVREAVEAKEEVEAIEAANAKDEQALAE